ncbi:aconitate hydratase AcnA [Actinoplanes sp. ATCC 53533]|uniref:aconitate hydratase AcnA n=1 Tax=Actinoplanes sp. ATCC 53533 TaxID=1288362 RepID=UPI0018F3C9B7|nr:aconitate hydratase AcnA [Actinoplanes sp. ATCC 53533]
MNSYDTAAALPVGDTSYAIHGIADLAPADLPYSLRVVLENLLRHGHDDQVPALLDWGNNASFGTAVDLHPSRAFLHDTNGVPTLVDLAAMRDAIVAMGGDPARVNPLIPAELVVDHSVIADVFGRADARERNVEIEYGRNAERYRFLRWGQRSLRNFAVVPPGAGIMHQVNVEYLARVVTADNGQAYPDVCLGTDSHTTMVNGLGVLGWGIGGIEAEAVMLGQSLSMLLPRIVGVRLHGRLPEGTTATDLVLTITELMRRHGVVGKFVEFSGPGIAQITLPDRATIANMSPEFGSTCAYFPIDDETLRYLRLTGRSGSHNALVEAYAKEQGLWHDPQRHIRYSELVELDLTTVVPSLAGPRRPQDRVALADAKQAFSDAIARTRPTSVPVDLDGQAVLLEHGHVAIAAITSCTNTSNPAVMVAAGLLARNAVQRGLRRKPWVKTSLSPGSRVVTDYYDKAGITPYLDELGFQLAGYGCMTCIGASGPLIDEVTAAVKDHDLSVVSVLSGNRNFDGRINPDVRMNYLASPPLVVAYAIAGTMNIDLTTEPLGEDLAGQPVYLRDIWPAPHEVQRVIDATIEPGMFSNAYADVFTGDERWRGLDTPTGPTFAWDDTSSYLRRPPYFDGMAADPPAMTDIVGARILVKLGDSVTTDHISPAGAIPAHTPAGRYLEDLGVTRFEINTYASRRGNHEVMMRGTFANVRLRNQLTPKMEGGYTRVAGDETVVSVYDAAIAYRHSSTPLIVLAGKDYGSGSSRDWAAKGPALLGVRAVIAESFERIHRSNLIGMGVLPLQFLPGDTAASLGLTGEEAYTITGLAGDGPVPANVTITADSIVFTATARLDTAREAEYHRHGGIMPYVLRSLAIRA